MEELTRLDANGGGHCMLEDDQGRSVVVRHRRTAGSCGYGAYWAFYGSDPISGRVTSYSAACLQKSADGRCTP